MSGFKSRVITAVFIVGCILLVMRNSSIIRRKRWWDGGPQIFIELSREAIRTGCSIVFHFIECIMKFSWG